MSSGKVKCTCGWSWNKSDSSKKDMYICHECGRDNSNNMQNGGWLDNYNDSQASAPEGMIGDGFSNVGRNYSPAWGGSFQMGGNIYPVNYVPQAQDGELVGDAGQELIDYLQRYSKYTKGMPGIGSAIGITESLANGEDMKTSDKLGLFPHPYTQAASLTALYAEKEKQNLEDYAKRQLEHNSFSDLLEEKTKKQLVNNKKVDNTYVPKPKVEKIKPKTKQIPYVEQKDINPVVIDNTAVGRSRKQFQTGGLLKDLPKVESFYKKSITPKKETTNVVKDKIVIKPVINERLAVKELKEINNNQQKIEDAKSYYKKYLNSPKAKERITNMIDYASDPEYDRLFPEEKNSAVNQEIKNRLEGLNKLKGKFDYINDIGTDSSSYYSPATNVLHVRPNSDANISYANGDENEWDNKIDLPNTIGHELGHGIQRASNKNSNNVWYRNGLSKKESDLLMRANIGLMSSKNRDEILNDKDNPEYKYELDHDNKPSELKADIDALRYQLYRQGIYDAGTQDFTREHLEKAKPSFTKSRLDEHFTDDELIDLMNKLSYNDDSGITPIAQTGGSMPGATGSMYARIGAPSKGPHRNQTDVTDASAQNGLEMKYYQNGLDWKPKSISKNGSIVKDDNGYWNPENWGSPVEIGSNNITMEGVYEPLLGVSDTGDTKLMEPGKNYKFKGKKVTEYPVAQDGKTFTKNVDTSLQFQKDWMNSTRYKEMLNKSTENDWIDRDYAEDRLKNLEELTKSKSYNIRESEDEYGPIGEEANSNPDTGVINIYKEGRNLPGEEEENLSHEISHTTDNPRLSMIPYRGRLIPQSDIDLIEKYKPSTYKETGAYLRATPEGKAQIEKYNLLSQKDINYKTEPTETRARLNVIRQYAKENNIYDPFTQKITPKAYEKLFKNKELLPQGALDLRSIYTKDELIDLLNTVSQNDNQDDYQNIAVAKNGMRQEQKGLVNLDQLTNFTNYNTKQPGGWLDSL